MKLINRFTRKHTSLYLSVIIVSSLFSFSIFYSCGANIFTVEDDINMGKELEQQIRQDTKQFPILQGHQDVKDYVSGMGKYVLDNSKGILYKNVFP